MLLPDKRQNKITLISIGMMNVTQERVYQELKIHDSNTNNIIQKDIN